jgi:hypothetical protein
MCNPELSPGSKSCSTNMTSCGPALGRTSACKSKGAGAAREMLDVRAERRNRLKTATTLRTKFLPMVEGVTISGASTTQISLQRETEDACPGHISGRFAREGASAPGCATPDRRRRGLVPAKASVATTLDALPKQSVYKGGAGNGTTRSRVRISPSSPNKYKCNCPVCARSRHR